MSESLGLTSHKSSCNCTGCGMLRGGVCINCAEKIAALILESSTENSPPSRARVPAARRSSCTSPRRQSAGARRERCSCQRYRSRCNASPSIGKLADALKSVVPRILPRDVIPSKGRNLRPQRVPYPFLNVSPDARLRPWKCPIYWRARRDSNS